MKNLLIIILMLISSATHATVYHVAASGGEYTTIAQVNAASFSAGDQILFNRGETFTGTLTVSDSGSSGNPITYGAYGTGANPIISGLTTLTGWTNEGGNIYSKIIPIESNFPNMVLVDNVNTAMGRWPNAGTWNTYESHVRNTSITDNQLTGTPNWTGAQLILRVNRWSLDRCPITNHIGTVLTFTPLNTVWDETNSFGYFIQNDLKTLDAVNEWFYDGTKFYIYGDPLGKTIKISTTNRLLVISSKNYITVENITFEGANSHAIQNTSGHDVVIQNCSFLNIGITGIYTDADSNGATSTIDGNTFNVSNNNAIQLRGSNNYAWVKNNTISNIGLIKGSATSVATSNAGNSYDAMALYVSNLIIEYNTLSNIGHIGIGVRTGSGVVIRNNFVSNFGLTRYDSGGIYTWTINGVTINNNIVDGSNTVSEGIGGSTNLGLFGIYIDETSQNINIYNNTVLNVYDAGFQYFNSKTGTLRNNTSFNNGIQFSMGYAYDYGYDVTGMSIKKNIFVSKTSSQIALFYRNDVSSLSAFGVADSNYYARPIDDNQTIQTRVGGTITNRTLAQWQTLTSQDASSKKSFQSITNLSDYQIEYNATKIPKTVTLTNRMIDVKGNKYNGKITLQPYTSLVLIRDLSAPKFLNLGGKTYKL